MFNAQVTDICEINASYGTCKSEHETIHLFSTVVSGVILKLVNYINFFTSCAHC